MTDKEKADLLIELIKTQLDHFKQTRDLELKVSLALWTLIAVTASFLYGKVRLTDLAPIGLFILIAIIVFVGHVFLWLMPIQNSEDKDDYFINKYRDEVEGLTGLTIPKQSLDKRPEILWRLVKHLRKDGWSWILTESGITLSLLIVVGILLWWN